MKIAMFVLTLFISVSSFAQEITCDNNAIKDAFNLALNTVDINTRRGVLAAGGDYGGEWTRDIAINSWNGVSLLRPKVAERSLWSVTLHQDTIGHQYWDKIIWAIAAYNHYQITGDKTFLKQAYICSANTMNELENRTFDAEYGLFMGPSVFNDGIAGYPEPIYEQGNLSSSVLDHKNSGRIKCLSTNCTYYGAYMAIYQMSIALKMQSEVSGAYLQKAETLKKCILKHLYYADSNTFNYLIDHQGTVSKTQEGLGVSFAVMFGIISGEKANQMIGNVVVSNYGITSIYPDFPRYSAEKPGRHNNIIWPMVNGFFADAAVVSNNDKAFAFELNSLTHLALDEDKGNYNFREIYNPTTGKPDGGYQASGKDQPNFHWESCRYQTWSATAYLSMVLNGVFGLRFADDHLSFEPYLPSEVNNIGLKNLVYRHSVLNINIQGKGKKVKTFIVDGKTQKAHSIASTLEGSHVVDIELE